MRLIDDPVLNRRKQVTIRFEVAEQQAVVRNDDVGILGQAPRTVNEAHRSIVRALATQAIEARRGYGPTGQSAVVELERIDIVELRLLDEGEQRS